MTRPECAPWCNGDDDQHRWDEVGEIVCSSAPINYGGLDVVVQRFANLQEDDTVKTLELAWIKSLADGDDLLSTDLTVADGSIDAAIRAADGLSRSLREARAVLAGQAGDTETPELDEIDRQYAAGTILSPREFAIAQRDLHAVCEAIGAQLALCQCMHGFTCDHAHMKAAETPREALLRRLRAAQSDLIGTSPDPTTGEVEHERVGVLPVDVAVLIHHLETTPIPIGATA